VKLKTLSNCQKRNVNTSLVINNLYVHRSVLLRRPLGP
jgi:hypothetical protein